MAYAVTINAKQSATLLNVRASDARVPDIAKALRLALPKPGEVTRNETLVAFAIARDEWLLTAHISDEQTLFELLDQSIAGTDGAVAIVSDAYAGFNVSGPGARDVMSQLVPIDLHPQEFPIGSARRTAFGRASALVHHLESPAGFDVYIERPLARYALGLLQSCSGQAI